MENRNGELKNHNNLLIQGLHKVKDTWIVQFESHVTWRYCLPKHTSIDAKPRDMIGHCHVIFLPKT